MVIFHSKLLVYQRVLVNSTIPYPEVSPYLGCKMTLVRWFKGFSIVFRFLLGSGFGFFWCSFLVPFALYLQHFGTRICDFAWYLLHFGMVTLHFAWYLLHFGMVTLHFLHGICYIWPCSPSILHGICHVLALQPLICMVFATFWYFKRSCGFLESFFRLSFRVSLGTHLGFHLGFHAVFLLGFHLGLHLRFL